jgi:RND superfamily putative drug exporter
LFDQSNKIPYFRRRPIVNKLGRFINRARRTIVVMSLIQFVLLAVVGAGAVSQLSLSRWEVPGSESYEAGQLLEQAFDAASPTLVLLVTAKTGSVHDPDVREAGLMLTAELAAEPAVKQADSYWLRGGSPTLRSEDGRQALILASLNGTVTEARTALGELSPRYMRDDELLKVEVGGQDEIFRQAAGLARQDFIRAEMIILPGVFLLLFLVYRRFRATALTIGAGLYAMVGTLAGLAGIVSFTEVSTFALNLALVMGLGLGIDYSLFMITRFREELAASRSVQEAVVRTVNTAGRTVLFSGVTVAAACAVLFVFPFPFLQSFAYTGVLVVLFGLIGSIIILPAWFAVLGERLARRRRASDGTAEARQGLWTRYARHVMKRPALYGASAAAVLLLLASPVLDLRFGLPDHRVLPPDVSSRVVEDQKNANFLAEETDAIRVVAPAADPASDLEAIRDYAARLSEIDGIVQVDSLAGSYADGRLAIEPERWHERFAGSGGTYLFVIPSGEAISERASEIVREVRAAEAPFDVLVGGYPADLTDFRDALLERVPLALALIFLVTFVLLFLMTGSLLIPLKATVLNMLSLTIMFGALVWVFQEGNLSGLLAFTPAGSIEPSIPILMFCIAYGLSMDYEVFILSRIKEEYDRSGNLEEAVAEGLQRSGSLVTMAAGILAFTFAAYAFGDVVFLKMLGIGMTLAILVDTTLIRAVLVPAFMKLAGRANWWLPRPLRELHNRFGISESGPEADPRQPIVH